VGLPLPPRPCLRASSALLDVERAPGSLRCPGLSWVRRSPAPCDARSFRRGLDPLQSPSPSFSTVRPVGRLRPPLRSLCPTTTSSRQPLCETGCSIPAPVPLSGFLNLSAVSASSGSTALFRAATVPGLLPSEPSPHGDRVPLSRPLAPLRSSTDVLDCSSPQPCYHRFPRRPRFRRSCQIPPTAMGSLSTNRDPLPGCPGLRAFAARSASFTRFGAFLPP
jgi:hypothetical protein